MKLLSRVVWAEGMYLAPQHFQAQNRYFEEADVALFVVDAKEVEDGGRGEGNHCQGYRAEGEE